MIIEVQQTNLTIPRSPRQRTATFPSLYTTIVTILPLLLTLPGPSLRAQMPKQTTQNVTRIRRMAQSVQMALLRERHMKRRPPTHRKIQESLPLSYFLHLYRCRLKLHSMRQRPTQGLEIANSQPPVCLVHQLQLPCPILLRLYRPYPQLLLLVALQTRNRRC